MKQSENRKAEVTQLNFNMLIFMEANVALYKARSLKIRYLKNQLRNS